MQEPPIEAKEAIPPDRLHTRFGMKWHNLQLRPAIRAGKMGKRGTQPAIEPGVKAPMPSNDWSGATWGPVETRVT